ncbi:hypothetical protein Ancab_002174 [Ancistrocladus abbreviatus]
MSSLSPATSPDVGVVEAAPPPENDSSPPLPTPLSPPEIDHNSPPSTAAPPPTPLPSSPPPLASPPSMLTLPPPPPSSLSPPPAQPPIPDPPPAPPPLLTPPELPPLTSPPENNPPLQPVAPPPTPITYNTPPELTPPTSPKHSIPIGASPPLLPQPQPQPPPPPPSLVEAAPPKANPTPPTSSKPPISTTPSKPTTSPPTSTFPVPQSPPFQKPPTSGAQPVVPSQPLSLPPPSLPSSPLLKGGSGGNGSSADVGKIVPGGGAEGSQVSTGVVVGLLFVGALVLILLVVFSLLLLFCRKSRRLDGGSEDYCGSTYGRIEEGNTLPIQSIYNVKPYQELAKCQNVCCGSGDLVSPVLFISSDPGVATALSSGTFKYEDLLAATDGFSEANLLGQGGFGYVYKGILPDGKEVAVKQLKMGGQQAEREFRAEVETISQVHHKHLVSLVGYCISGADRLLVYEFVPNKTLEFHLHGKEQPVMEWDTRLKIAIGSAKGLAYLHEDCNPTIIHRDIKAANILLDFNFEAKVSDFGMAKIFSNSNSSITHITTRVVGTFGYLAPEYASSGKVTDKSDVYSFGVMLLELITGRPPITTADSATNGSLVNWARPLLMHAIEDRNFDTLADPRLQNSYNVNEMASMVACAAACVRLSAWRRPRMSQVVRALEGDLSPSDLSNGIRPGQSTTHLPYESSDFDPHKRYMEEMKNFRMALMGNYSAGMYSDNTSEYGLYPSASSTDSEQTTPTGSNKGRA